VVILIWWISGFHLHHQIKITPFNFSVQWPFLKYLTRLEKPTNSGFLLTRNKIEEANKAVAKE